MIGKKGCRRVLRPYFARHSVICEGIAKKGKDAIVSRVS